jgi:hypothetical protein
LLGANRYVAPNPDFGALLTYYLRDGLKTKEQIRQASEDALLEADRDIPFPGWDAVGDEMVESDPAIWVVVKDSTGKTVRRVRGPTGQGMHRVAWDLRYPAFEAVGPNSITSPSDTEPVGMLVAPGSYSATLARELDGEVITLTAPVHFEVAALRKGALPGSTPAEAAAFWRSYEDAVRDSSAVNRLLGIELARADAMKVALSRATIEPGSLDQGLERLRAALLKIEDDLYGSRARRQVGERTGPTIESRLSSVELGVVQSTYGPTATHRMSLEIVSSQLRQIKMDLATARAEAAVLGDDLLRAGAPWVEGNPLPER